MPYNIRTRDGILLQNIPDDWEASDARLKQMVQERRNALRDEQRQIGIAELKAKTPGEYDPSSPEYQERYGATSGMSHSDRRVANLGAGLKNLGIGFGQLALPKQLEAAAGITDESIGEERALQSALAQSTPGGKALQIGGEVLPSFAVPGGAIARGFGMLPKVGAAIKGAGVGSRAIPTLAAEGAAIGGAQGLITPTTSAESVTGNTLMGAGLGGAGGGAAAELGFALRPLSRALQQRNVAKQLGDTIDVSPKTQKALGRSIQASSARVVDAPQSAAALTQSPELASLEIAARANPETAPSWTRFDEAAGNARWKALSDALGSDETVKTAKAGTDAYVRDALPEVWKGANRKALTAGVDDFRSAVQGRLTAAVRDADPARQEVYGYVIETLEKSGKTPQALWNIRKTLSDWVEGIPPPGKEGTRGAKMDVPIRETKKAIDAVLNRVTGKKWAQFLDRYSDFARKETAQKAGQNIRNAFFDETLSTPRGATTSVGNPAVTRARLEQALTKHGKNEFGETLNYQQRNVVDQVLSDLRADEILARAKSSMTGKSGSQTAPLQALMKSRAGRLSSGWVTDIANAVSSYSQKRRREIVNSILQSPEDALLLIRQAERIKRPLSVSEKRLVYAARSVLASPSTAVLANKPTEQT